MTARSSETVEKIQIIAADVFGVNPVTVTEDSSTETIGTWDSLQHTIFLLALEDRFGVSFSPEEMEAIRSIRDAASIVNTKLTN